MNTTTTTDSAPIRRALGIFFRFQVTKFSAPRLRFQVFFLGSFFVLHLFSYLICSQLVCLLGLRNSRVCAPLWFLILIIFRAKAVNGRVKAIDQVQFSGPVALMRRLIF